MLNFENMQEVARKMRSVSDDYVEAFWQNIFDAIEFDKDYCNVNYFEYSIDDTSEDRKLDPHEILSGLNFSISIDCCGLLMVKFNQDCIESNAFILSAKCLLKNHFFISDDEETEFTFNLGTN